MNIFDIFKPNMYAVIQTVNKILENACIFKRACSIYFCVWKDWKDGRHLVIFSCHTFQTLFFTVYVLIQCLLVGKHKITQINIIIKYMFLNKNILLYDYSFKLFFNFNFIFYIVIYFYMYHTIFYFFFINLKILYFRLNYCYI